LATRNTNEKRSQWAIHTARRAALYVAQARLELARLAYREDDQTSPVCRRARELADTLGELVERIQREVCA
jgi:hypothetical protein